MIEVRPSKPEEVPAQKALWKTVFGDDDVYIDNFYRHCAKPEDMLVLLEDGALRSMLALLSVAVALPDGSEASSAYVYALATDPAVRGQGFGRVILQYVDFYLREKGVDSVTVVPAEAGLHKFFGTVGFTECFATRKIELLADDVQAAAPGDGAAPIGPQEYGAIRERLLSGTFHAAYDQCMLSHQRDICLANGGNLYRVTAGGATGCAAVERNAAGGVAVKELLIAPEQIPAALAVLAETLPAARYHLRTPAFWHGHRVSYVQPFAMIKWLSGLQRRTWGEENMAYFGLAFD